MHRIACILFLASLSAPVLANGAMGLGLEMWDYDYWLAYVAATIVLEAVLIGRWMRMGWGASIGVSLLANAITALMCTSLCAVGLHSSFVGSRLNPNPFWNGVWLLTWLAIPSALVEAYIWAKVRRSEEKAGPLVMRSLITHLIGVPVALCILLIPERPYVGLEVFTARYRGWYLRFDLKKEMQNYVATYRRLPSARTLDELIRQLPPENREGKEDAWAAAYVPRFGRFDVGENRRYLLEYNSQLAGRKIDEEGDPGKYVWLIRPSRESGIYTWGLAVDPVTGYFDDVSPEDLWKMPDR